MEELDLAYQYAKLVTAMDGNIYIKDSSSSGTTVVIELPLYHSTNQKVIGMII